MKYMIMGAVFLSMAAMFAIPNHNIVSQDMNKGVPSFYGAATLVAYDATGKEIFSQTIHNQLVDSGEDFMLQNAFHNGTITGNDDDLIGAVCIASAVNEAETETASSFDAGDTIGDDSNNCKQDTSVSISSSIAKIGPLTFGVDNNNLDDGETIAGIGVCQNTNANDNDFANCVTNGILFAVVDTTDVTLSTGETVDVTYTFDLSSGSS